ncbi:T9SS type A sorting domain-containing protein [Rhodocytophaga aerolata]|uniref:T9SS type A sorting domain-containing protein n=1 Tax=Rhodocytophaga aerolata TaxID=455078 RepID=A0ABT8RHT8_9BACT|nr:T9SS type A sorting domain-containing protein [Rhodocytophaga aerolata]MDO1451655.1 T9SS type A sorting domain-containing protein [Rhodocytophaga aerolata]
MTGIRTYAAGSTFVFNGATAQVTGNGFPTSISNLIISNTASTPLVTANQNLAITGTASFSSTTPQTLTLTGDLSGTGTLNMSGGNLAHTLNLQGASNSIGNLITSLTSNSIINYTRNNNQTVFASPNYRNLTISGSGIKTLQGNSITVGNNLSVSATLAFSSTTTQTLNVSGDVSGVGTIDMTGGSRAHVLNLAGDNNSINRLLTTCNSIVNYTGGNNQTIISGTPPNVTYGSLNIVSGIKTLTGPVTVCNLTVNTGATLDLKIHNVNISGNGNVTINGILDAGTGAITGLATSNFILNGIIKVGATLGIDTGITAGNIRVPLANRTYNTGSSIEYNGTTTQVTGTGLPASINSSLIISNPAAVTLSQNLSVSGSLTINSSLIFGTTAAQSLTIQGNLIGTPGGTIDMTGGSLAHTLNLNGTTNAIFDLRTTCYSIITYGAGAGQLTNPIGNTRIISGTETLTINTTECNLIVPVGATLNLNGFTLNVLRSVIVEGTLDLGAGAVTGAGTFTSTAGSALVLGSADGINSGTTLGNIRVSGNRTFDPNTNIIFNRTGTQVTGNGFPLIVGNVTINNGSQVTLSKNLVISNFAAINGMLLHSNTASQTVIISGDLTGSGTIDMSGGNLTHTLNLGGLNNTIGLLKTSTTGNSTVNYDRNGNQTLFSSNNYRSLILSGSGIKTLPGTSSTIGNSLTVSATLVFSTTTPQTVIISGDLSGSGTIDMSGGNLAHTLNLGGLNNSIGTLIPSCNSVINYTASGQQTITAVSPLYNDYTISGTITLTRDIVVCNNLLIPVGATLNLNGYSATVNGSTTVNGTLNAGIGAIKGTGSILLTGTLLTASPDGINAGTSLGSIRVSGSRNLTSGSFTYNGTLPQVTGNGLPASVVNLTIENTAATPTVSLSQSLTISSIANFTSGSLVIGNNTLTLNGRTTLGSATITGGNTSNLIIGGNNTPVMSLPAINNGLFNVTLAKSGTTASLNLPASGLTIYHGGTLTLTNGSINNGDKLLMGDNATAITNITRHVGSLLGTPVFNNQVNVTYVQSVTTGPELPTSSTTLNNLTVGINGFAGLVVTMNADVVVNGTYSMTTNSPTAGISLNGRTLTINGNYNCAQTNNSVFIGSPTSSLIISGANKAVDGTIRFSQATAASRSLQNFTLNRTGTGSAFTISTHAEISNATITSGTLTAIGTDILITNATIESNGKFINNSTAFPLILPSSTITRAFNNETYASVNKFDKIAGTVTSNNTDFTFTRGSGSIYALRSRDFIPAPTAAIIRFDLSVMSAAIQNDAAQLMLGNGFSDDGTRNDASTASRLRFNLTSGNVTLTLPDGTATTSPTAHNTKIWWVVNRSGGTLTYTGPNSSTNTIASGTTDLWVGTNKRSASMKSTAITLSEVKMVFDQGNGSIALKNLQINPIAQLVANVDCWYAGHPVDINITVDAAGGGGALNAGTTLKVQRSMSDGTFNSDLTKDIYGTLTIANPGATTLFTIPVTFPDNYSTLGVKDLGINYRYRILSNDLTSLGILGTANNQPMYYIINPGPETLDPNNATLATVTATTTTYTTSYWGYRLSSGAATIIPIPNTNSVSYTPKLNDFPGPGEYYLVAVSTTGCISNQKKIFVNCSGANLIINGDFNQKGATRLNDLNNNGVLEYHLGDFYTEYNQRLTTGSLPQGSFAIDKNPIQYNGAFCDMTTAAHRAPTAGGIDGGNMLITDASPTGSKILWQQKISNLKVNTNYVFTFWGTSIDRAHQNTLKFGVYVNCYRLGDDIADNYASSCNWVKYSIQINTGNETELTLGIGNVSVAGSGNDVGIDNIEFYECDDQSITFQPLNKFVWIGYTSDWFKSDNWGVCEPNLPACGDNVIIPANLPAGRVYPVITANYPDRTPDTYDVYKGNNINGFNTTTGISLINQAPQVQNITIEPGARLTINSGYNLRICGNMINNGTILGNGTITFYGNTQQNVSGTGQLYNVAIDQGNSTTTAVVKQLSDVTVNGLLDINKASDELVVNGKTLYLNGTISTNPGTITGITSDPTTTTSSLVIGGTGNVNGTLKLTSGSQSLAKLTMNRTSNGQVTLGTPITLVGGTNSLTLMHGVINTTQTNFIRMDELSTVTGSSSTDHLSGGSNVSYVNGPMIKLTNSTSVFTFPVGNSGYLGEIGIEPKDNVANAFRAEYFRPQGFPGAAVDLTTLDFVSPYEYWKLDRVNGTSSGKISLHWTASTNIALLPDWSDLRVARYSLQADTTKEGTTIANGIWQSRGKSAVSPWATSSSGYITSDLISQFSPYTFGSAYYAAALPVEFVDLKATVNNKSIDIEWLTASEHNSDFFIVERSENGKGFTAIQKLPAAGESKFISKYIVTDKNPLSGNNYYRIKQVDKDGKALYSKIVSAHMNTNATQLLDIYPNPSDGRIIYLNLPYKGEIQVTLYNILGVEVYKKKMAADGSILTIQPHTPLSNGIYIVSVEVLNKTYQQKIIVR